MDIHESLKKKFIQENVIIRKAQLQLRDIGEKLTTDEYRECMFEVSVQMLVWRQKGEVD